MASWNDPSNSNDNHVNLLKDLADKDTYTVTMGQTNLGAYTDLPDGTMNWDNGQKLLRRVQSGTPEVVKISLAGGGTGASDAAGARSAFNVLEAGTGAAQSRTNTQNDERFVQQTRTVSTTSPLSGGGALSGNLTLSIQDSTTSQKGAVQLNNTLTSTSTSQALTAAQGKVLKDMFSDAQLSAPVGDLITGGAKISKAGNIVVISNNISGSGFSHNAASFVSSGVLIPVGLRPSQNVINCYYAFGEVSYVVQVTPSGFLTFQYSQTGGAPLERTSTGSFTISYTI